MALNMTLNTLWETSLLSDDPWWLYLVYGAGWTISLAVASFALALTLGTIVGTLRTVDNKWIRGICEGWIELFRNIPLIVQIFIWYFVVPELIPPYKDWMIEADPVLSQFLSAFLCMGLFTSSRIAEHTRLRLTVTRQGSGPARALGDKVLCTVVPAEQSGVPFFLGRFRRRYALLVGLALSLTAVCVLSQFVLTIEVEGNEAVSTAEILTELRRQGLRPGVYGPGLDEGTISSAALLGLPELAWMSVNLHGIRAEVLVREAVPAPEVDDEEQVGSIVARSSGIVTHIEPLSGEALVAQGDTVLAGEVLISGAVTLDAPQYSELENLGQILVRAQGQVFARTWHTMTASIPLEAQVKSYTGEKASRWTLSILGHRIDFFGKSGISFPEYDKITDTWALTLPGGREMPLALSRETCRAYTIAAAPVDADAAERLLEERLLEALRARLGDGEVVHTSFSSAQRDGRLEVTLQAECTEEIGRFVPLESITEENEAEP